MRELTKIMLIEDDEDIRDILVLSLGTIGGFTLSAHETADEALGVLDAFEPDMILLDVMLPGLSGPEALPRIRACPAGQAVCVVFLTAKAAVGVRDHYLGLGAQEVLFKPFDPMRLPEHLRAVWQNRPHDA